MEKVPPAKSRSLLRHNRSAPASLRRWVMLAMSFRRMSLLHSHKQVARAQGCASCHPESGSCVTGAKPPMARHLRLGMPPPRFRSAYQLGLVQPEPWRERRQNVLNKQFGDLIKAERPRVLVCV